MLYDDGVYMTELQPRVWFWTPSMSLFNFNLKNGSVVLHHEACPVDATRQTATTTSSWTSTCTPAEGQHAWAAECLPAAEGTDVDPISEDPLPEGIEIAKFHKAAGHPTNRNLARIIKDAGHPEWKAQVAREFYCPSCESPRPGGMSSGQVPPASTHGQFQAWEAIAVDSAEWIPPGKKKVKFLLFMDVAPKLRVAHVLYLCDFLEMKAESGSHFIEALSERWLSLFPRPRGLS